MKENLNKKWDLITIDDPAGLPGQSFLDLIELILKVIKFKYVILDDIIGALTAPLQARENTLLLIEDLLKMLPHVKQFDWGEFFLFKEYHDNWSNPEGKPYASVFAKTDTTIRAVDDTYIYVYTPLTEITDILKENYKIESLTTDFLENLPYPY